MGELLVQVPESVPVTPLKKKIDELVKEEVLRWALFERCKDDLAMSEEDLNELERIREDVRKRLGCQDNRFTRWQPLQMLGNHSSVVGSFTSFPDLSIV